MLIELIDLVGIDMDLLSQNGTPAVERIAELVQNIDALETETPSNLKDSIQAINRNTDELRGIIGGKIASVLNKFSGEEIGDLSQKKEVAQSLNDLLDSLGLRIKCPKTGRGAVLIGAPRGDNKGNGRFELSATGIGPKVTFISRFPKIELILKDMETRSRPGRANTSR